MADDAPQDNLQILTQDDVEKLYARISVHEFLIEILLANLWGQMSPETIQSMKQEILERAKTPIGGQTTGDVRERIAKALEIQCEHLLDKAEERLRKPVMT